MYVISNMYLHTITENWKLIVGIVVILVVTVYIILKKSPKVADKDRHTTQPTTKLTEQTQQKEQTQSTVQIQQTEQTPTQKEMTPNQTPTTSPKLAPLAKQQKAPILEMKLTEDNGASSGEPIYGDWNMWSACQGLDGKKCGRGIRRRTRECMRGECIAGFLNQTMECDLGACGGGQNTSESNLRDYINNNEWELVEENGRQSASIKIENGKMKTRFGNDAEKTSDVIREGNDMIKVTSDEMIFTIIRVEDLVVIMLDGLELLKGTLARKNDNVTNEMLRKVDIQIAYIMNKNATPTPTPTPMPAPATTPQVSMSTTTTATAPPPSALLKIDNWRCDGNIPLRDNEMTGKMECIGTEWQDCIWQETEQVCKNLVERLNTEREFNNEVFTKMGQVAKPVCDYRQTRLCLGLTNNMTLSGLEIPVNDNGTSEGEGFSDNWECKEMNGHDFIVKKVGERYDDWKCLATGEYCMPQEKCENIVRGMNTSESFNKVVMEFPKVKMIDVCKEDDSPRTFLCRALI